VAASKLRHEVQAKSRADARDGSRNDVEGDGVGGAEAGGRPPHGGGAFSGKDPSKVDRSAAYARRWVAKNVVAAGLARKCEVQVAYAIGKAAPVGFYIDTFGTASVPEDSIRDAVLATFDLRPAAIIRDLNLLNTRCR